MIRDKQAEHLSSRQRTYIRRSLASERGLARFYGVSVRTIRLVRATADPYHPARRFIPTRPVLRNGQPRLDVLIRS